MRQPFNEGWQFVKTEADCSYEIAESKNKQTVCLPHDWVIGNAEQFYQDADGWYFKTFFSRSFVASTTVSIFLSLMVSRMRS